MGAPTDQQPGEATPPPAPALQERYAPASMCFGCGPANPSGLHIRSYALERPPAGETAPHLELVAEWQPSPVHEAFPGALNGGICAVLMDCHANWAAAMALMRADRADQPPATVTASYEVHLLRPTPTHQPLHLRASVVAVHGRHVEAAATILAGGQPTATFRGRFVAVGPDHPAYERWGHRAPA
jgi:acyl-coenzyme A thioesterase PaaI-like protein